MRRNGSIGFIYFLIAIGHEENHLVKLIQVSPGTGYGGGNSQWEGARRNHSLFVESLSLIRLKTSRLAELQSGRTGQPDVNTWATLLEQSPNSLLWLQNENEGEAGRPTDSSHNVSVWSIHTLCSFSVLVMLICEEIGHRSRQR